MRRVYITRRCCCCCCCCCRYRRAAPIWSLPFLRILIMPVSPVVIWRFFIRLAMPKRSAPADKAMALPLLPVVARRLLLLTVAGCLCTQKKSTSKSANSKVPFSHISEVYANYFVLTKKNVQKNISNAKIFLICQYIHNDLLLFKG